MLCSTICFTIVNWTANTFINVYVNFLILIVCIFHSFRVTNTHKCSLENNIIYILGYIYNFHHHYLHSSHTAYINCFGSIYVYRYFSKTKLVRISIIFTCRLGQNITRKYKMLKECLLAKGYFATWAIIQQIELLI